MCGARLAREAERSVEDSRFLTDKDVRFRVCHRTTSVGSVAISLLNEGPRLVKLLVKWFFCYHGMEDFNTRQFPRYSGVVCNSNLSLFRSV